MDGELVCSDSRKLKPTSGSAEIRDSFEAKRCIPWYSNTTSQKVYQTARMFIVGNRDCNIPPARFVTSPEINK